MHVPKKNIDPVVSDIKSPDLKRPSFDYEKNKSSESHFKNLPGRKRLKPKVYSKKRFYFKRPAIVIAVLLLFFVGGFLGLSASNTVVSVVETGGDVVSHLVESARAIKNFEIERALVSLEKSMQGLEHIKSTLNNGLMGRVFGLFSSFMSPLRDAGSALGNVTEVNRMMLSVMHSLDDLQNNGFVYFRDDGEKLIVLLESMKKDFTGIHDEIEEFRNKTRDIKNYPFLEEMGIDFDIDVGLIEHGGDLLLIDDFLAGLLDILSSREEKHVLLMFHNSSEIRPAGGFLGSYGVLTIQNGEMKDLIVDDIYWPDHPMNFDLKLVPPPPLQHITTEWGARDANWFFDFPKSAETVMELLQESEVYLERDIVFDGAIALNVDVLGTVMELVGSIEVEEYEMVIDENNFLAELQREVEVGRDARPGENPKKILSVIAPEIMDRLEFLPDNNRGALYEKIEYHLENKDIMFHASDRRISRFLEKMNIDGSIYGIPSGFWGSYLAVVNANVAGGKTDIFVSQDINANFEVFTDGGVIGEVAVKRNHFGEEEEDPWYNTENRNYLKFFLNPNINPLLFEGGMSRPSLNINYEEHEEHLSLRDIFDSREFIDYFEAWQTREFGRTALGTWVFTSPGEESLVRARYTVLPPENFVFEEGKRFRFIFDKQSGVNSGLNVSISAPPGFVWAESRSRVFKYEADNTPARVILELTVSK